MPPGSTMNDWNMATGANHAHIALVFANVRRLDIVARLSTHRCDLLGHSVDNDASVAAQPGNNRFPNAVVAPPNGPNGASAFGTGNPNVPNGTNGRGGAANADFDSLIDLITSTIDPETWAGRRRDAEIRPFPGGVLVDAAGTLRLKSRDATAAGAKDLIAKRGVGAS